MPAGTGAARARSAQMLEQGAFLEIIAAVS